MPIYEYRCLECEKEFEEIVFGKDEPPCPACGSEQTTRLISCACLRTGGTVGSGSTGRSSCAGCSGGSCSSCH